MLENEKGTYCESPLREGLLGSEIGPKDFVAGPYGLHALVPGIFGYRPWPSG